MAEPSGRDMKRTFFALCILTVAALACRTGPSEPRRLDLYPSPTVLPTQTARVVVHTSTPLPTQTPVVQVVTNTPEPEGYLCVTAVEAVHLRPSPSTKNYPITPLPHGAKLTDLGGREEDWAFVVFGRTQGWVKLDFVEKCE